jgi:hypothetical protein
MLRGTMWILLVLTILGGVWAFVPARAQFVAPPALVKPQPPPSPAAVGTTAPADPFAGNDTEAAIRSLQNAVTAQYRVLLAKGEIDPAARERLAKSLGEIFDLRQQLQQREIQMLEDRLRGIKDQVAARAKQRDAAIAAQVERIVDGKEGAGGTTPPPKPTLPPMSGGGLGGLPALGGGFNPLATVPAPKVEVPRFEPIQIGLPDDLIGQLLQAKNDADRALIGKSVKLRIALLQTQLTDAQTTFKRYQELAASGAIDRESLDRAGSRVKQLMLLLEAHETFGR